MFQAFETIARISAPSLSPFPGENPVISFSYHFQLRHLVDHGLINTHTLSILIQLITAEAALALHTLVEDLVGRILLQSSTWSSTVAVGIRRVQTPVVDKKEYISAGIAAVVGAAGVSVYIEGFDVVEAERFMALATVSL